MSKESYPLNLELNKYIQIKIMRLRLPFLQALM